ncbi:MAG: HNH endonuclease [Muribaculaceae bacterium]|nr:HNH endonuclease [Muribaculaceae bacterium]
MTAQRKIISDELIDAVWQKATVIPNNNPSVFRQDYAGAWIRRDEFGKSSTYGWQIDHIVPVSMDGTDDIDNLVPLHYINNLMRANRYPRWQTEVSADGDSNAKVIRNWYVEGES